LKCHYALFRRRLSLEKILCTLTRRLGTLQIYFLSSLTHICQHYHALRQNLHIAPVDGEHELFLLLTYDQHPLCQQRHEWLMLGKDPQLPFGTWDQDFIDITGKQLSLWTYNSQL
jgi:hypothetical protein